MEYNVAVVGEVDASKSTLIGVLSSGKLDDGRGSARLNVLTLKHEKETGRTSNINSVLVEFKQEKKEEMVNIRFLDLAGHEKYINTTLQGLTTYFPNFALLLVAANKGVTKMTEQHFKVCYSMHIPIIICITKIDMAPPNILKDTIEGIKRLCKPRGVRLHLYEVKDSDTRTRASKGFNMNPYQVIPYFKISNVTGVGISLIKEFLPEIMPEVTDSSVGTFIKQSGVEKLFFVYKPYFVNGIGFVAFGKNCGGPISRRDKLLIGPINNEYHEFTVRSIHNAKRELVSSLLSGESGCLALAFNLRFQPTKFLLKRVVIIDRPIYVNRMIAEVFIFSHQTTLAVGYNPYIHCGTISTSAKVTGMFEKNPDPTGSGILDPSIPKLEYMRIGNKGFIEFTFPSTQFVFKNAMIIFREGGLRGVGRITSTIDDSPKV